MNRLLLLFTIIITLTILCPTAEAQQAVVRQHTVYELCNVEQEPQFPGGDAAMVRYINSERCYPPVAYSQGISGRVVCEFVVSFDGSLSEVRVLKNVEESLDREAVRIISNMPKWQPATIADAPVSVRYILAIPFRR